MAKSDKKCVRVARGKGDKTKAISHNKWIHHRHQSDPKPINRKIGGYKKKDCNYYMKGYVPIWCKDSKRTCNNFNKCHGVSSDE